jgi:2'-5' RNA ligase
MPPTESALVVLVPTAEALVKPFRDRHDPGAAAGMPAHITVLYPFCAPEDLGKSGIDRLRTSLSLFTRFQFSLRRMGRFSGVLFLAPEPDLPFRQLTTAIWQCYPNFPPYGGGFDDPMPHLTLAQLPDEQDLDRVADEFACASQGMLPIHATASQVALMDNEPGRWQVRAELGLGPAA